MRLFLAIELSPIVRQGLGLIMERLRSELTVIGKVSCTREPNLHVTLKFLGEVEDRRLPELAQTLSHVRSGGAIEIFADGIECFPRRGPVRILAAGFGGALDALAGVHRAIEQRCEKMGFDRERRVYRPHTTLIRARPTLPGSIRARAIDAAAEVFPLPSIQVKEFVLMQSHLTHEGSRYEVLARFGLAG